MSISSQTVFLLTDGASAPDSLEALIRSAGWKPETTNSLLDRLTGNGTDVPVIRITVERSGDLLHHEEELRELSARYASLTAREREVMALVVAGRLNKQVGGRLGISEITVKAHRGKVMRKMGAGSLAELVGMALILRLPVGQEAAASKRSSVSVKPTKVEHQSLVGPGPDPGGADHLPAASYVQPGAVHPGI